MLKRDMQLSLDVSNYLKLYDILVPMDSIWRKMRDEIDFSFVYEFLSDSYSDSLGRTAIDVIVMFKLLLLKAKTGLSDRGLIHEVNVNLEYKYFLEYNPEDIIDIDPTSLTNFRRTRLAKYEKDANGNTIKVYDKSQELMDLLISKTVKLALDKKILKKRNIGIVDSTHTLALYGHISPREKMITESKKLRAKIYAIDPEMKDKMPKKREISGLIEDEIDYCKELVALISSDERFTEIPGIKESINSLNEIIDDTNDALEYSKDTDAKIGHKTADTSFFGYKTHIMMSDERIITAATITSGEKNDGKELKSLIEKTQESGIELEAVVGDGAYAEKVNLEYCSENNIKDASKLSKNVTHGTRNKEDEFEYNKDAGMYVCKAGHMAIRKAKQGSKKDDTQVECYYFDVDKCKHCPLKDGCYKENAKSKTYSVKIKNDTHIAQMDYMETEEFKNYYSNRYKIEAKNSELKNSYNYAKANACGQSGITIQGASALFLANISRIYRLEKEKISKNS